VRAGRGTDPAYTGTVTEVREGGVYADGIALVIGVLDEAQTLHPDHAPGFRHKLSSFLSKYEPAPSGHTVVALSRLHELQRLAQVHL
jgi:hypothetical protein